MSSIRPKFHPEKLADALLGLSLLGWAIAGLIADYWDGQSPSWVRISLSALQISVGWLILARPIPNQPGSWMDFLLSAPSLLASGWLFKLSQPHADWPLSIQLCFAAAVLWVLWCFWHLRKSFAIFPALRQLVKSGPYRILRHPAYLGEWAMAIACAAAMQDIWTWLLAISILPLLILRIQREENCLAADTLFSEYKSQTRYRLIPFIW